MMLLEFQWAPNLDDSTFICGDCNIHAYKWLQSVHLWPKNHTLIVGPRFSGKTHLATIWAARNNATIFYGSDEIVDPNKAYIVDLFDNNLTQEDVMRLFYQTTNPVLWIGRDENFVKEGWSKDLQTRFMSIMTIRISQPDEEVFKKIFKKRCKDFGLILSNEALEYLVRRVEITYDTINDLVLKLHNECLLQQKMPTIAVIHQILEQESDPIMECS